MNVQFILERQPLATSQADTFLPHSQFALSEFSFSEPLVFPSLFEVRLPVEVVGIGVPFDFNVPLDGRLCHDVQENFLVAVLAGQNPASIPLTGIVALGDPLLRLFRMSAFGPFPTP